MKLHTKFPETVYNISARWGPYVTLLTKSYEIHPSRLYIPMQRTRCLFWADQAVRKDEVHKTWHCNAKLSHGQIWADMGRWPLCGISLKMFGLIGIYTAGGAVAAEMFQFQHRQHRSRCQSRCFSSVQITHWALRLPALRADPTVHNARGRWSTCDAVFHCMTKTTINDDKRGYMTIYQVAV